MKNKSTYSLIVDSEEKGRGIFEGAIYALVILCAAFSSWQFASNSVALPRMPATTTSSNPVTVIAKAAPQPPVIADRS
jgi:hypothetical protein